MTLAEIIANANANSEFIPGMSSNELFFGTSTNDRLTDVIADVAEAVLDKADSEHTHSGYAPSEHSHSGYAPADHSHNYAAPTHSHGQSDITGLPAALASKADASAMSGKADLVDGKVPASQLPSFVDDVLEYDSMDDFPTAGESGKIYVAENKTYRWSGTGYVEISASIALGETASTAYRGDRGKIAYDHSQNSAVHVTAAQKEAWDGKAAGNHGHSYNDLSDKPTIPTIPASLPANGGNADTVDGKHASDFAPASHTHSYAASNHTHTPASIGAAASSHTHDYLPSSGGTVNGDVNFVGVVRVKGQQAIFDNGTRQTFGSGNREHYAIGTKLYCNQSWTVASDERLKENVESVNMEECVSFIDGIRVKTFNYIGTDAPCMGVIAQEVQAGDLAKFFVSADNDGYLGVKAADLVFPLIAAVQALSKRVAELEAK